MKNVLPSSRPTSNWNGATFGDIPASGYWRVWLLLFLPPFLLVLISIAYAFVVIVLAAGDKSSVEQKVADAVPYIIIVNHGLLLILTFWFMKLDGITRQRIGWPSTFRLDSALGAETLVGIFAGVAIYIVHQHGFGPFASWLSEGTPGLRLASESSPLGSNALIALCVAMVLGGFVEEQLYRGYALVRLTERMPLSLAVFPMLISFGLLHFGLGWTGILVTTLTGLLLTLLFIWRRSLVSVVIAHAMVNLLVLTI